MNIGHIKTERIPVDKLNPATYNPRTISPKAKKGLANSIERFGLLQPIVWNRRTGNIIGGHQRLVDLIEKGATETDVIPVDFPIEKEKAANIALNHSGISGEYIEDQLQTLLEELDTSTIEDLNLEQLIEEDVDYSMLGDDEVDEDVDAMAKGAKSSIILVFGEHNIELATSLTKFWKERDADVGAMYIEKLNDEKNKLMGK
jgi:ParB-like chromosome segregation protein Spo0J